MKEDKEVYSIYKDGKILCVCVGAKAFEKLRSAYVYRHVFKNYAHVTNDPPNN